MPEVLLRARTFAFLLEIAGLSSAGDFEWRFGLPTWQDSREPMAAVNMDVGFCPLRGAFQKSGQKSEAASLTPNLHPNLHRLAGF